MLVRIVAFFIFGVVVAPPPDRIESIDYGKCGYESCHPLKEGFVNVHIVPHTHDDVGWLKTVDQYYYGSKTYIQKAGVQYILDSVIEALRKEPSRRFIYVETAFFWKWWMKQHDFVKHQVKKFIRNGQLEMTGGGWSMNDEAVTNYHSIIDQFTWGLRKLNDTFGKCGRPKIGWQIDPFGHSREMASIFAQLGFDGLLLGRIDYQDKRFKFSTKTPEFVWQGSDNLGDKAKIFTSVMYNNYSPPPGFCFDVLCSDEPIIDDKKSPDYNVNERFDDFVQFLDNQTKAYATDNAIVTMGGDFTYMDAHMWFHNIDKLIRYGNQQQSNGSKYHLIYSTPSCYLKAVQDEAAKKDMKWFVKTDDFFPYASDPNSYWTGYFTSRPTLKRFERQGNNFLQVCKQLYALANLGPEDWVDLNVLREAMGVMQHHDAITGTEKEHVAHDYARMLTRGFDECQFVAATALSQIVSKKPNDVKVDPAPEIPFESCLMTNVSRCNLSETSQSFVVTVYNPLSRPVSQYVRLPVTGDKYNVLDPEGGNVEVQMVPIADPILNIPGRLGKATVEMVFIAKDLPPLGFKSYYVRKMMLGAPEVERSKKLYNGVKIKVDKSTGILYEISMNGKTVPVSQDFFYYRGATGNNFEPKNRSSGAYIFRPNGTETIKIAQKATYKLYEGALVTEIHQTFNEWVSQIIRIYSDETLVEFDWLVGPIPQDDFNGKEIITKYSSPLNSDSTFYTDSNGREVLKRVRNFRPTWKLNLSEPVAGNYYPVTSKIAIRDSKADVEIAVLTDRAQGGSSLNDGEIELMLHRDCNHDDAFGVGEALQEEAFGSGLVVRGSHYLVLGSIVNTAGKSLAAQQRDIAQRKLLSAWTFLSPTNSLSYDEYKAKYKLQYSGLKRSLPDNVQILTLEPWKGMSFLLRLEHVLERNEDADLSKSVTVDLKDLFSPFEITSYEETTLGANQWLKENEKLEFQSGGKMVDVVDRDRNDSDWQEGMFKWMGDQDESNDLRSYYTYRRVDEQDGQNDGDGDGDFKVTLEAMQIRTFVIEIRQNN